MTDGLTPNMAANAIPNPGNANGGLGERKTAARKTGAVERGKGKIIGFGHRT